MYSYMSGSTYKQVFQQVFKRHSRFKYALCGPTANVRKGGKSPKSNIDGNNNGKHAILSLSSHSFATDGYSDEDLRSK